MELLERRFLDRPRPVAERIAIREAGEGFLSKVDELGRGDRERLLQEPVLERRGRALGEPGLAHVLSSPARIWARGSALARDRRRERPPPICMGQPPAQATTR